MANWGAIFDWDGVIIDSRQAHEQSWERLAREIGKPLPPDHMERGFGRRNESIIPDILEWTDDPEEVKQLGDRKEALYREIIGGGAIDALPGVRDLLDDLRRAGVPCAVGTSTARANVEVALETLKLEASFAHIVSAEDVTRGKPAPDVFLLAAERLNLPPERCIVFEDAPFGVEAALTGGMLAVGVATTRPADHLDHAHRVVPDLAALSAPALEELLRRHQRLP